MAYSVLVTDNYRAPQEGASVLVTGFATLEAATEYARRRTRASVEELRSSGDGADDVRSGFLLFGETSAVVAGDECIYDARHDLEFFVAHPASAEESDWLSLEPDPATPAAPDGADVQAAAPLRKG
jgi:hypothetical protein